MKIALAYLTGTGCRADEAFEYVGHHIAYQMGQGVSSPIMLSNKAIAAFQRHRDRTPLSFGSRPS